MNAALNFVSRRVLPVAVLGAAVGTAMHIHRPHDARVSAGSADERGLSKLTESTPRSTFGAALGGLAMMGLTMAGIFGGPKLHGALGGKVAGMGFAPLFGAVLGTLAGHVANEVLSNAFSGAANVQPSGAAPSAGAGEAGSTPGYAGPQYAGVAGRGMVTPD